MYQKYIKVLNVYTPNDRATKMYEEKNLRELRGEMNYFTIIVGQFKISHQ